MPETLRLSPTETLVDFIDATRDFETIAEVDAFARQQGAAIMSKAVAIVPGTASKQATDIWLLPKSDDGLPRVLVHQEYPGEPDVGPSLSETALHLAGVGYYPVIDAGPHLTFRQLPLSARRLHHYPMHSKTQTKAVVTGFLVPVFQGLYTQTGMIPSEDAISRLTHVEQLDRVGGQDYLHTGPYLLPPYGLEPVGADEFVEQAVARAESFGSLAGQLLSERLKP